MPFKANDQNHPSKNRLRKRTRKLSRKRHTAYTPTRRNAILQSIAKGVGVAEACRNAGVLDRTAPARWVKQSDPLVASTPGRKKKLDDTDRSVIYKLVEKQPFISSSDLSKKLYEKTGKMISQTTINVELSKRKDHPFTSKSPEKACEDKNLDRIYDLQLGFKDGVTEAIEGGRLDFSKMFYEDECPIFESQLPRKGRTLRGEPLFVRQPYRPCRYTFIAVISVKGVVKADLIKGNMNDAAFRAFCLETQEPTIDSPNLGGPPLATLLPPQSFLIWDRLGRSGRSKNPTAMHYNPEIHQALNESRIAVKLLPPKGCLLNPIELFNSAVKSKLPRIPDLVTDEYGRKIPCGPQTFDKCRIAVSTVLESMKGNPSLFQGFYKKRASGMHLEQRISGSKTAKKVMKDREEVLFNERFDDFISISKN